MIQQVNVNPDTALLSRYYCRPCDRRFAETSLAGKEVGSFLLRERKLPRALQADAVGAYTAGQKDGSGSSLQANLADAGEANAASAALALPPPERELVVSFVGAARGTVQHSVLSLRRGAAVAAVTAAQRAAPLAVAATAAAASAEATVACGQPREAGHEGECATGTIPDAKAGAANAADDGGSDGGWYAGGAAMQFGPCRTLLALLLALDVVLPGGLRIAPDLLQGGCGGNGGDCTRSGSGIRIGSGSGKGGIGGAAVTRPDNPLRSSADSGSLGSFAAGSAAVPDDDDAAALSMTAADDHGSAAHRARAPTKKAVSRCTSDDPLFALTAPSPVTATYVEASNSDDEASADASRSSAAAAAVAEAAAIAELKAEGAALRAQLTALGAAAEANGAAVRARSAAAEELESTIFRQRALMAALRGLLAARALAEPEGVEGATDVNKRERVREQEVAEEHEQQQIADGGGGGRGGGGGGC